MRRPPHSAARRLAGRCLLAAAALAASSTLPAAPGAPSAPLYVVVHQSSPVRQLAAKDLIALYTGRMRSFPGGEPARPLDQARDSAVREQFYLALTGMDLARMNSYWARLQFSGQLQPPPNLGDDAAVVAALRRDPTSAIGYLTREPADPTLRVVLVVRDETR